MAPQQVQFTETIRAMKLALKRRADDSDSDRSIHAGTNRGHKLQKRSQYVQSSNLDSTGGTKSYRREADHAGYTRNVISTAPTWVNVDGDVVSGDNASREGTPLEEDPFGTLGLDILLRPLMQAQDVSTRPTYRKAFLSTALTEMVDQVAELSRKERAILWQAKRLLQRFRGDAGWMPCEAFETDHDQMLLFPGGVNMEGSVGVDELQSAVPSVVKGQQSMAPELADTVDGSAPHITDEVGRDIMDGVEAADMAVHPSGTKMERESTETKHKAIEAAPPDANGDGKAEGEDGPSESSPENGAVTSIEQPADGDAASEHSSNSANPTQHAMTTRARARSPVHSPDPSPTPSDSASIPAIHPWFLIPPSAIPDRDLGLPAPEAEESRRGLLLYVQKQEQTVRALDTLYSGLRRADRIRRQLWSACKAEAHVRDDGRGIRRMDLSDGEDWYDPFDWGLEVRDLKMSPSGKLGLEKGKDEIDEVGDEAEGRRGGRRRRVTRM